MQYESSITHRNNLAAGLTVAEHREIGSADWGISLVRYSDGSTWAFDNASGWRVVDVYGWHDVDRWFLTMARAESFGLDSALPVGPGICDADLVELRDILP